MKRRALLQMLGLAPIVAGSQILGVKDIIPEVIPEHSFAYNLNTIGCLDEIIEFLKENKIDFSFLFIEREKNGLMHLRAYLLEHMEKGIYDKFSMTMWAKRMEKETKAYYGSRTFS